MEGFYSLRRANWELLINCRLRIANRDIAIANCNFQSQFAISQSSILDYIRNSQSAIHN